MKRIICSIGIGIFTFNTWAQNPNPDVNLDNTILSEMTSENLPGVSTVIVKGGEIVWVQSYGLADVPNNVAVTDNTVFMLASVSKLFTGTALMQLSDNETIDLDEDINNHLPFTIEIPGYESDSITFRQLMTHTSSIKDGDAMDGYYSTGDPTITLSDCIQRYFLTSGVDYNATDNFHSNAPGTLYDYSNIGTALAGYMVEEITGIPFDQYCRENIFDPLCMNNTDWHLSYFDTTEVARPHQYANGQYNAIAHYGFADYPNGLLRADIEDISNFMITYLNNGTLNGNQILSPGAISEMLSAQVPSLDPAQGLNWYTEVLYTPSSEVTVWGHNGGENGVSTDIYIDPNTDIGIAVISNGEGDCLTICDELYSYALGLSSTGVGVQSCESVSIKELSVLPKSVVSPNPFGQTTLVNFQNLEQEKAHVVIINLSGKQVASTSSTTGNEILIDKGNLASGFYFYSIRTNENMELGNGKIVIE